MGDMLIRNIPESLKSHIAKAASRDGSSLSGKAIEYLRQAVTAERANPHEPEQSAWDALRGNYEFHGPVSGDDAALMAEIMDEIELERKRDFGRAVPEFE